MSGFSIFFTLHLTEIKKFQNGEFQSDFVLTGVAISGTKFTIYPFALDLITNTHTHSLSLIPQNALDSGETDIKSWQAKFIDQYTKWSHKQNKISITTQID